MLVHRMTLVSFRLFRINLGKLRELVLLVLLQYFSLYEIVFYYRFRLLTNHAGNFNSKQLDCISLFEHSQDWVKSVTFTYSVNKFNSEDDDWQRSRHLVCCYAKLIEIQCLRQFLVFIAAILNDLCNKPCTKLTHRNLMSNNCRNIDYYGKATDCN